MFRYMATAVVDKDVKSFDSTYKEALNYMSFISKDKVYRHGGEVSGVPTERKLIGKKKNKKNSSRYSLTLGCSDVPLSVRNWFAIGPKCR